VSVSKLLRYRCRSARLIDFVQKVDFIRHRRRVLRSRSMRGRRGLDSGRSHRDGTANCRVTMSWMVERGAMGWFVSTASAIVAGVAA
jgi:hypothetical protein